MKKHSAANLKRFVKNPGSSIFNPMMRQYHISLPPYPRGFHLITGEILAQVDELPATGIMHCFIQHTSAGLCINENADPEVRRDFELYFNKLAPEHLPGMRHTLEGSDDMPAHIKTALTGTAVSVPIANHQLCLGTWQGIYLCEFRNRGGRRKLIVTIYS